MSKLTEYLALIPKAFQSPKEIAKGWLNRVKEELGTLPEDEQSVIAIRRSICSECHYNSVNAKKLVGYKTSRTEEHCTLCSCPLLAKTASLSSVCGAQYYNETHKDKEPLPVRWKAYEKSL